MFECLLFSMPVMRTVWRRDLDWMLFVRECMLWLPSERGGLHHQELLDLIYLMCSLNLMPIALPDCPTYTLIHVLHFNLYIPLGSLCLCLVVFSCCWIVLVARKLIFTSVCLNKLVIRLTSGLWYVKVTYLQRCVVISSCCCVWACFCFFLYYLPLFCSLTRILYLPSF